MEYILIKEIKIMNEELNKSLDILELERTKEILPDYIHKNIKSRWPIKI